MSIVTLKKKLKALNYPTDFSEDSQELVDRLLGDLIRASEAYQALKRESAKQTTTIPRLEDKTLQNHIQVLQKENNELHTRLLACEEKQASSELASRKLASENKELSALVKFYQKGGKTGDLNDQRENIRIVNEKENEKSSLNFSLQEKANNLEKINDSLKTEINRLRNLYEGAFKPELVELKSQALSREQQRAKEEAFESQMSFLLKRNEELEEQVRGFKNSRVPLLCQELEQTKTDLAAKAEENKALEQKLKSAEIRLQENLRQSEEQIRLAAQSQSPGFLAKMLEELQAKNKEKNEELLSKEKELLSLKRKISEAEGKFALLSKEKEEAGSAFAIQKDRAEEFERSAQQSALALSEKEFELQGVCFKLKMLENQLEDYKEQQKQSEEKMKALSEKNSEFKGEFQNQSLSVRRINFDLEQAKLALQQKQELIVILKEKTEKLESELKQKNLQIEFFEAEKTNLKLSEERNKEMEKTLFEKQANLNQLKEIISQKDFDLFEKEQVKIDLERKADELVKQLKAAQVEREQMQQAIEAANLSDMNKAVLEREVESLRSQAESSKVVSAKSETLEAENRSLKIEGELLKQQIFHKSQFLNDAEEKILALKNQIESQEESSKAIFSENCGLQIRVKSLEEEIGLLARKLTQSEQNASSLQLKGQKAQGDVHLASLTLTECKKLLVEKEALAKALADELKKKSLLSETLRADSEDLQFQLKEKQSEVDALKISLAKSQRQVSLSAEREQVLSESAKELEQQLIEARRLQEDQRAECQRLGLLLSASNAQKEELLRLEAQRQTSSRPVDLLQQFEDSRLECARLRDQLKSFETSEHELRAQLLRLDKSKDEAQELLDERTLQAEELAARLGRATQELVFLKEQNSKLEQLASQLSYKAESLTEASGSAAAELDGLREELRAAKKRAQRADREKSDLASDLQILAAENRTLANEAMILSKRIEAFEKKLEVKLEELKKKEFELSACALENGQLKGNCRMLEQEAAALRAGLAKAQAAFEALQKSARAAELERDALRSDLLSLEKQREGLLFEISALQNNYNKISVELQGREITGIDKEQEARILQQKVESLESANSRLYKELTERQKSLQAISADYNDLKQNFIYLKGKNEELVGKLATEVRKSVELESALAEERSRQASILGSIHKNKAVTSDLESKIENVERMIKFK